MAINRRTMAVSALIASMWGGVERSAEAQNQRLPMRVVVYDYTDSEPAILQQAQRAVTRIFGEIDVDVTWLDVAQFTREMPPEPSERQAFVATVIQVSVIPPAMHKALGRKGTVVGGAGLNTRRIWISFSRVQETARRARADAERRAGLRDRPRDRPRADARRFTRAFWTHAAKCRSAGDCPQSTVLRFTRGATDSRNLGA